MVEQNDSHSISVAGTAVTDGDPVLIHGYPHEIHLHDDGRVTIRPITFLFSTTVLRFSDPSEFCEWVQRNRRCIRIPDGEPSVLFPMTNRIFPP